MPLFPRRNMRQYLRRKRACDASCGHTTRLQMVPAHSIVFQVYRLLQPAGLGNGVMLNDWRFWRNTPLAVLPQ